MLTNLLTEHEAILDQIAYVSHPYPTPVGLSNLDTEAEAVNSFDLELAA
jgi:hypothetical protein